MPRQFTRLLSVGALAVIGFISELPAQDGPCGRPIVWDFNDLPSCSAYGILTRTGGALGECFVGQTVRDDGKFETVSGAPSFPLRLKDSGPDEGLCAYNAGGGDIRVAGLRGPMGDGCSNPKNIGEGALSLWFQYGTPWVTMNNWCDSDFFETVTAKFYARDGSLIQTVTNCEHLAFHINGDQPLIYGVVITNDDGGGIGFDNVTFLPSYEDLGNELLDPYDPSARSFEDIFPDPALGTAKSGFTVLSPNLRPRVSGNVTSAAYWSPSWSIYAYLFQVEVLAGSREHLREVCLPFAADLCVTELNSFHLEDDPAGSRCGLGGDLLNHFENYGFEENGHCVNRAARPTGWGGRFPSQIRGAGWVTRFADLGEGEFRISQIVGVLSTAPPVSAQAVLLGERSLGTALVIAPRREPIAVGAFFQGINAPDISGMDVLMTAIVRDPILRERTCVRVFDPGDKEKIHRQALEWILHNAPQAADQAGSGGHSHGGDRSYRVVTELRSLFDAVGADFDWLAPVDPIDPFVCEDLGNCSFDEADQSDILKPAPAGVVFLNHVQRHDPFLRGYNIGNWAEDCTSGEETRFSNLTCEATWVWFHTEIDNDPRVQADIVSALAKLFP